MMSVLPYGDSAVLVNFDQKVDVSINEKVLNLNQKIKSHFLDRISFTIPAYCSLTIGYKPSQLSFQEIKQFIDLFTFNEDRKGQKQRKLRIPVCYDGPHALDMDLVIHKTGLSQKEIISIHCSQPYHVYMLGFLPGFPYMGLLNEKLFCKRKLNPNISIPKRSVAIAGEQTGIYPQDSPGGWNVIGRTPIDIFKHENENPFLFAPGDQVTFYPISENEYLEAESLDLRGKFNIGK